MNGMTDAGSGTGSPRLDEALAALPQRVDPSRDLWPGIESRLAPGAAPARRSWAWQAAAAVFLVVASSLVTATLVRRDESRSARDGHPGAAVQVVPASLDSGQTLNPDYEAARTQLSAMLRERMQRMPPSAREKLAANLAEMRRAADEINAALAQQPGDPLLEELLLNTYQDELAVLANVNQLTSTSAVPTATDVTRMQL